MSLRAPVTGPETAASPLGPPIRTAPGATLGSGVSVQAAVIERLRSHILSLERHAPRRGPAAIPESVSSEDQNRAAGNGPLWKLGCDAGDGLLPGGLDTNAVHEIKGAPSVAGGASAVQFLGHPDPHLPRSHQVIDARESPSSPFLWVSANDRRGWSVCADMYASASRAGAAAAAE